MRKKVDSRIRTLIENGVKLHHRTLFVIVGDAGTLDGSGSFDADGELASYDWTLLVAPEGSTVEVLAENGCDVEVAGIRALDVILATSNGARGGQRG